MKIDNLQEKECPICHKKFLSSDKKVYPQCPYCRNLRKQNYLQQGELPVLNFKGVV